MSVTANSSARPGLPSIRRPDPVARFNLRVATGDRARLAQALGCDLPDRIGQGAVRGGRAAWCLGPDEWLIHAPEAEAPELARASAGLRAETPHSLTDISDREVTLELSGTGVLDLLATSCPIDLSRLAPGMARRTLFDTAQIVLIRDAPDRFRIEAWRSFEPHVSGLLEIARRELASGV